MTEVVAVGFRGLKDFHPALLADGLRRTMPSVAARATALDLDVEGRAEFNALGLARAFDQRDFRRTVIGELTSRLHGDEVVAFPAALGIAAPHEVWSELEHGLGRPVFEVPTLPPSVPGMRVFAVLRDALRRAGGSLLLNNVVVGAEHEQRPRAQRCASGSGCARSATAPTGSCSRPAASPAAGSSSTRAGRARETALGLPVAGVPGGRAARASSRSTSRRIRSRAPASRSTTGCDRSALRRVRERAGHGRDARGRRAVEGEERRRAEPLDGTHGGRARAGGVQERPRRRSRERRRARHAADARVARPLRQVHDLRDVLPGLERHAAVSRPEVRGAAVGALPGRRRAVARRVAGLLLRLRDLHAGVPAGRAHRRDQHAGAREAPGEDGPQAARPRDRAADAHRAARDARRAGRELVAVQPRVPAAGGEDDRHPPPRPGAEVRRADVPALGAQAHLAARRSARSRSSTAAARTTTSRGWAR